MCLSLLEAVIWPQRIAVGAPIRYYRTLADPNTTSGSMMMKRLALLWVCVAVAVGVGIAAEDNDRFERLSDTPVTWQLDFRVLDVIKPIALQLPGEDAARTFWYLRYRITNETGQARQLIPSFDLCTNTGQLFTDRTAVPKTVYDAVKELHNQPLLENLTEVTGQILEGEDNAIDGVAIWPDIDPEAGKLEVYVGGLSGDQIRLKLPVKVKMTRRLPNGESVTVETDEVVLRRTLLLVFDIPGEAAARRTTPALLLKKRWMMR